MPAQMLADEESGGRCRHQRGRAARDRIDLAEIARAVALGQCREIEKMDEGRRDEPRPCCGRRQAGERQADEAYHRGADGDRHYRHCPDSDSVRKKL